MAVLRLTLFMVLCGLGHAASVGGKSDTNYDTIVIGMGAAGTAAATTLARAGKWVLALEAQGRIGGRVNTVQCGKDGVVELGAEWIHGIEGSPTYKLAVDHNVTILPQISEEDAVWSDGQLADHELLGELINVTLNSAFDPPEKPESVGAYVSRRINEYILEHHPGLANNTEFLSEFLQFADLVVDSHVGADNWNDVTTHGRYQELGGSQEMSWHKNGYKTLFNILLNKYKDGPGLPSLTIKLNTEVSQIVWPQEPTSKVVVKTKDGAEYTADNVIVTVSVGVLKERHSTLFSPALPPKKVAAIETIPLGVVNKVVLFYPEPWWTQNSSFGFLWKKVDKDSVPEEDKWVTKILGVSPPMGCDNALTLWTNGDTARHIETLSDEVVKAKSMEMLKRFLGASHNITEPTNVIRTTWYSNPFTRGSYSFEGLLTPQHPSVREDLAEPLKDSSGEPRVLFAGEASHPTQFSTVHGAVASGNREAARLLRSQEDEVAPGVSNQGIRTRGTFKKRESK